MRRLLRPLALICWLLCGLGSAWAGGGGVSALMAANPHQGFDTGYSTNPSHRYGFQGEACPERSRRESDDEMYGDGNAIAFTYRVHACPERSRRDPRIGRFLSVDPLAPAYPWNSPYAFSENRVLDAVELEGLERRPYRKPSTTPLLNRPSPAAPETVGAAENNRELFIELYGRQRYEEELLRRQQETESEILRRRAESEVKLRKLGVDPVRLVSPQVYIPVMRVAEQNARNIDYNTPFSSTWRSSYVPGSTSANSTILRRNLGLGERNVNSNIDASHVVPTNIPEGAPARSVLQYYQIDINHAVNGVVLVGGRGAPADVLPRHHRGNGLHSTGVTQINRRLNEIRFNRSLDWSQGRTKVIEELGKIRTEIYDGTFPAAE